MAGMGELHLEVYAERMRREYGVDVVVGAPKVNYREAPTKRRGLQLQAQKANRRFWPVRAHRRVVLICCPTTLMTRFCSRNTSLVAAFPRSTFRQCRKGSGNRWTKGPVAGYPIIGVKTILEDGSHHEVDSSDMAFRLCARGCFRETFLKMKPVLLEPIMKMEVECPSQFQGHGNW